jgi:hypothetical protein
MKVWRIIAGILAANFVGALVCGFYALIWFTEGKSAMPPGLSKVFYISIYPNLLLVPMAMGLVAAFCWRDLELRKVSYFFTPSAFGSWPSSAPHTFSKKEQSAWSSHLQFFSSAHSQAR